MVLVLNLVSGEYGEHQTSLYSVLCTPGCRKALQQCTMGQYNVNWIKSFFVIVIGNIEVE